MKLAALGDLFLGDQVAFLGFGVRSYGDRHGYDRLFDGVRGKLKGYDFVVANLETVLSQAHASERGTINGVLNRGNPAAAAAIKNSCIQLLTLANNHIFDYGRSGVDDTIAALEAAGLSHCGTRQRSIHVQEHNDRLYAFLSWSLVPDSSDAREVYNVTDDPEAIVAEIRKTRPNAFRVILSLHAGNEFIEQPSEPFQRVCRGLVDAGADIVLGHHPHVLQPVERYKHGLIAYSLGNFVFGSEHPSCRAGMVLGASVEDATLSECAFFEIDKRTYSPSFITDTARIADLARHVGSPKPLPSEAYLQRVRRLRAESRRSTMLHVLKTLHRTKWRLGLFRIAMGRFRYLWSIRKAEAGDPNLVYRGPRYMRRKQRS